MNKTATQKIKYGLYILLLILGILDIANIIKLNTFHGIIGFVLVIALVELVISIINEKVNRKEFRFMQKLIIVLSVIEVTVFQFNSYHLLFGDYTEKQLDLNSATVENFENNYSTSQGVLTSIEIIGLNEKVGTITIDGSSSTKSSVTFDISIKDDTHSASYRNNVAVDTVIKDNKRSQTVPCNFSGKTHDLKITFTPQEGEVITINSITINKPIMFHFSVLRFLIFFIVVMSVYMLICSDIFKKSYAKNKLVVNSVSYAVTAIFILSALLLANTARYQNPNHSIINDFKSTSGNQITQEIVDAFESGHTYLTTEVSEDILSLENPYDWSQRDANQTNGLWDHLLYNGKYYSYYGIGPVILLFLPYHLITGYYFPCVWSVWLFGSIGILFMTMFWLCFIRKFFSNIRSSLCCTGLITIQLISGIWFCFSNPLFYEIAQTSGFAATMVGAYLLISSNVLGDGKIKKIRLALSSTFLSIAVLCRPTLAVYCICAVIVIFAGFLKLRNNSAESGKINRKSIISYWLSALLPFAVIGGAQMIYNYVRFGSFFDFGIQYSLTINDFTQSQYHIHFVLIGIFNYILSMPKFSERFPFFTFDTINTFNPQGYYFIATYSAIGLIWKAPQLLAYSNSLKAYKSINSKNKKLYALILFAVCIASPFAVMFSIWESGYGSRYCVDFAWQIFIGAMVIAFIRYLRCGDSMQKLLNKVMTASCLVCFILVFAQTYNWIEGNLSVDWKASMLSFARLFEFWI